MRIKTYNKYERDLHKRIRQYMKKHNCTLEQAVNDFLHKESKNCSYIYGIYDSINLPMDVL